MTISISSTNITFNDSSVQSSNGIIFTGIGDSSFTYSWISNNNNNGVIQFKLLVDNSSVITLANTSNTLVIKGA